MKPTTTKEESAFASDMCAYVEVTNAALDNAIAWIGNNLNPDHVFDADVLEEWARENGFIEKE